MRLARLSLATLALVGFTACNQDVAGPDGPNVDGSSTITPSGPRQSTGTFGSGGKANADSTVVSFSTQSTIVLGGES